MAFTKQEKMDWYKGGYKTISNQRSVLYAKMHRKIYQCTNPECKGLVFSTGRLAIIHKKVLGSSHQLVDINKNNSLIKRRIKGKMRKVKSISSFPSEIVSL